MAELTYRVSFAGRLFFNDDPRVFRTSPSEAPEGALRKQQPRDTLLEEIDRRLPWEYLNEYGYDLDYPGRNVGALARQSQGMNSPAQNLAIGDYYYPNTAVRWSTFRGLMTSTEYKAVLAATRGGLDKATFEMTARPGFLGSSAKAYGISTQMTMLPGRPIGETGDSTDGLYLVTLVDERFHWQYSPASLMPTGVTTWDDLIATIAATLGITVTYSAIPTAYGHPSPDSQLWAQSEDVATLFDAVAMNVGRTVVRNYDGTYKLYTPQESIVLAQGNRLTGGKVVRRAGGDAFQSGGKTKAGDLRTARQAVVPATVRVVFPKFVSEPVPHYYSPRPDGTRWFQDGFPSLYPVDVPLLSGGPLVSGLTGDGIYLVSETAKAMYGTEASISGTPLNASGLAAMATQIAQDYLAGQVSDGLDESYLGIVSWTPEGLHDVLFTYSQARGTACTRAMRSVWNNAVRYMQHSTPNYAPPGGGLTPALTVQSSSGVPLATSTLTGVLTDAGAVVGVSDATFFPYATRFKAAVDSEVILFEGTSGANVLSAVARGVDGTQAASHAFGSTLSVHPRQTTYNTNLIETGPGLFTSVGQHTAGGVRGAILLSPIRTLRVTSDSPTPVSGINYQPAQIMDWGPAGLQSAGPAWAVSRTSGSALSSGAFYAGQFVGDGPASPLYLVDIPNVLNYGPVTINYNGTTINWTDVTLNFNNVTINLTDNDFTINGPNFFIIEAPLEVCGWMFWCFCDYVSVSATINNWALPATAPEGEKVVFRFDPTGAGTTLTGMEFANANQVILLVNISTTGTLTLAHEDTGSTAANRYKLEEDEDVVIGPNGMRLCWYDFTSARWRVHGPPEFLLTVGEVDLSPTYVPIHTILFDSADGFAVTNPSPGVAQIDFSGGGGGGAIDNDSGTSTLASDYSISAGYASTGLSVSLPTAGTYLLICTIDSSLEGTKHDRIAYRLYNSTVAAAVGTPGIHELQETPSAQAVGLTVTLHARVVTSGAETVRLEATLSVGSGPAEANAGSTLTYVHLQ